MTTDKYEQRMIRFIDTCKEFDKKRNGAIFPSLSQHMDGSTHSKRCKKTLASLMDAGRVYFDKKDRLFRLTGKKC